MRIDPRAYEEGNFFSKFMNKLVLHDGVFKHHLHELTEWFFYQSIRTDARTVSAFKLNPVNSNSFDFYVFLLSYSRTWKNFTHTLIKGVCVFSGVVICL